MSPAHPARQTFRYHRLNARGISITTEIGELFGDLAERLDELVPVGREKALVMTQLETACFFAKKGVALQDENQDDGADTMIGRPMAPAAPETPAAVSATETTPATTEPPTVVSTKPPRPTHNFRTPAPKPPAAEKKPEVKYDPRTFQPLKD